ncbi:unnamed protein product [Vitrella brassicaformis CCMP3155]|uniref:Beta-glucosidase n=1 Tax=Vitrella brassicaformis (strain CCMP3155) TaxID=1169540 RepID=A0A0G4H7L1_VITBC|nr:unnamed protein product [Vitrella brassicaformis CCMP3155]|eukprot:CEM39853.1 unnamed protein product [Vitrella brassicaformis CCMP3155]
MKMARQTSLLLLATIAASLSAATAAHQPQTRGRYELLARLLQEADGTANGTLNAPWPTDLNVMPKKDPAMEAEIKRIVDGMTLEQKVAQMMQVGAPETDLMAIHNERGFSLGSLLSGPGSTIGTHEAYEWLNTAEGILNSAVEQQGVKIPYIWGIDAIHGHNNQPKGALFPHNIGLGAANDTELMKKIGEMTAAQLTLVGIDWAFAPCIAMPKNLRWGRVYEGYSSDPEMVRRLGTAMIKGLQGDPDVDGGAQYLDGRHVLASAKHWIGDGATEEGIDAGDVYMGEKQLMLEHAIPYFDAIEAGVATIMVSFSSYNGLKMHGHKHLIQTVLKDTLGFDGIVISDYVGHQHVKNCDRWTCPHAVNAGIDVYMMAWGDDWKGFMTNIIDQVNAGIIPEERINDAATRIIRVKARMGYISSIATPNGPRPTPWQRGSALEAEGHYIGSNLHRDVAREAVQKSIVLLKNNGNVLPLKTDQKILVVGRGGDAVALQCGGWSVDWLGDKNNGNEMFGNATTLFGGIQQKGIAVDYSFNLTEGVADGYDAVIVVVSENPYSEEKGDIFMNQTVSFARAGGVIRLEEDGDAWYDMQVLETTRARFPDTPIVTVMFTGRPLYANRIINLSEGFVVAWLPGTEGGGIADVLFGEVPVVGRLPFDWPTDPCDDQAWSGKKGGVWHVGEGLTMESNRTMRTLTEHNIGEYYLCNDRATVSSAEWLAASTPPPDADFIPDDNEDEGRRLTAL